VLLALWRPEQAATQGDYENLDFGMDEDFGNGAAEELDGCRRRCDASGPRQEAGKAREKIRAALADHIPFQYAKQPVKAFASRHVRRASARSANSAASRAGRSRPNRPTI